MSPSSSRIRSRLTEPESLPSFTTVRNDKQFSQQYANLYWLRLVVLRKRVEERARRKWGGKGQLQGELVRAPN
jgi:DNA polymerase delta subunit 2